MESGAVSWRQSSLSRASHELHFNGPKKELARNRASRASVLHYARNSRMPLNHSVLASVRRHLLALRIRLLGLDSFVPEEPASPATCRCSPHRSGAESWRRLSNSFGIAGARLAGGHCYALGAHTPYRDRSSGSMLYGAGVITETLWRPPTGRIAWLKLLTYSVLPLGANAMK